MHLKKLYTKYWGQAGGMTEAGCVNWGHRLRAHARVKRAPLFASQQTGQVSSSPWVWLWASAAATKTQRQVPCRGSRFLNGWLQCRVMCVMGDVFPRYRSSVKQGVISVGEPENVRWQGQRRRCIIETEARAGGWVRGVQDCGDVQVQNISSAFFSQELLGSFIGSSFRRMREGRS